MNLSSKSASLVISIIEISTGRLLLSVNVNKGDQISINNGKKFDYL